MRNVEYSKSPPRVSLIFEYNDEVLREVVEGKILAAPSFGSVAHSENIYALFEATIVEPMHITAERLMRYKFLGTVGPFLEQTARDLMGKSGDWEEIRDHAYVEVQASLLPYHIQLRGGGISFNEGMEKPVIGSYVHPLSTDALDKFVNGKLKEGIPVGWLSSSGEAVQVKINARKLITLHFSILGYTGHGKSNLGALLVSRILRGSNARVIIFDLSDEYTALLADILYHKGEVLIDPEDVPETLIKALSEGSEDLSDVAIDLAKRMKKPSPLEEHIDKLELILEKMLQEDRLKLLGSYTISPAEMPTDAESYKEAINMILERLNEFEVDRMTILKIQKELERCLIDKSKNKDLDSPPDRNILMGCLKGLVPLLNKDEDIEVPPAKYDRREIRALKLLYSLLKLEGEEEEVDRLKKPEISNVASYLAKGEQDLYIVVSTDSSRLSSIIRETMTRILEGRRKGIGDSKPILFVVDEAHEFAVDPRNVSGREREVARTIERLTRMGRKFNLGVAILSQRVAHLNTTALSNCHTMFLGALPRKYDRDRAADAYSISDDVVNQTVTFRPGEWLLLSHGATGLKNVPLIFRAENREKELIEFLKGNV